MVLYGKQTTRKLTQLNYPQNSLVSGTVILGITITYRPVLISKDIEPSGGAGGGYGINSYHLDFSRAV